MSVHGHRDAPGDSSALSIGSVSCSGLLNCRARSAPDPAGRRRPAITAATGSNRERARHAPHIGCEARHRSRPRLSRRRRRCATSASASAWSSAAASAASIGLRAAVEGLADPLHLLGHRQVADAHLAQIVVHVVAETVEQRLPGRPVPASSRISRSTAPAPDAARSGRTGRQPCPARHSRGRRPAIAPAPRSCHRGLEMVSGRRLRRNRGKIIGVAGFERLIARCRAVTS